MMIEAPSHEVLCESQASLMTFVESTTARMGLASVMTNYDLKVIWGNSALLRAWPGLCEAGQWRLLSESHIDPAIARRWQEAAQEAVHTKATVRFEIQEESTCQWLEFSISPVMIKEASAESRVSFIIENKTDSHRAVDQLLHNQQLLAAVINGSPIGIQVFDQAGTLRHQNLAMEQLNNKLNVPSSVGQFNILHSQHAITPDELPMARQALAGEVVDQPQRVFEAQSNGEDPLVIDTIYYPVKGQNNEVAGLACFHRDVSERRRLEEQLQQSQRLDSLGLLAGTMAHDFNGLLTAIYGFIDLAQNELPTTHLARTYLQSSLQAAMRATDLTKQLLAYAGKGKHEIKTFDLSVLVLEVTELLRSMLNQHGSLHLELSSSLPDICGDITQIRQLVMNLLSNAAESHESGPGIVSIKTDVGTLKESDLARCQVAAPDAIPGPCVLLQVGDQGVGITNEVLKRVFDPFFTTKSKGRGLGLAAIVGIVRGHRAALHVESHVGTGTTFTIYLPIVTLS